MAPRRAKKRRRSPSQKPRADHTKDFDLLPPEIERVPFSAPWHGAPKDEFSITAHLWPIELFEALYGVLWKAVSKKDPKWARRFHAALMEQVMGPAETVEELVERLARFEYPQKAGRPKGSGHVFRPAKRWGGANAPSDRRWPPPPQVTRARGPRTAPTHGRRAP